MIWSPQQVVALEAVDRWLSDSDRQVFRLFGYAGTGKTTLARHLAAGVDGKVLYGAYTGKAALVLRQKGCPVASTIHSMIYRSAGEDENKQPTFVLNELSAVRRAALVEIDEVSMVDRRMGKDLLSFGTKVLVIGDPAQLPPVSGGGFFTEGAEPDVMLTEVHRQARDNPIVDMATDVREGRRLSEGSRGESRVVGRSDVDDDALLATDQVLVGRNRTRRSLNRRLRVLKGRMGDLPVSGDKLVCLRNNHTLGLLNGAIWHVLWTGRTGSERVHLSLESDVGGFKVSVEAHTQPFLGRDVDMPWWRRKEAEEFDYGYALTVHKAQGSQWDDVILFDESRCFREDARRWLYTGVTRAAERLTVVRS